MAKSGETEHRTNSDIDNSQGKYQPSSVLVPTAVCSLFRVEEFVVKTMNSPRLCF